MTFKLDDENEGVTIRELVTQLHDATQRMSKKNKHRALLLQAMSAIMQLSTRIDEQKEAEAAQASRRVGLVTLQ